MLKSNEIEEELQRVVVLSLFPSTCLLNTINLLVQYAFVTLHLPEILASLNLLL
jgi:hypothetical protein